MVNCSAYNCKSRSEKDEPGVTFHSFPKDLEKRKVWISNTKINDWEPSKNSRLCSKHFEACYFYKTDTQTRVRLNKVIDLKNIIQNLETKNLILNEHAMLLDNMSSIPKEMLQRQPKKRQKYSPELRKFAISLNFFSPKAYNYVRTTFDTCLPHSIMDVREVREIREIREISVRRQEKLMEFYWVIMGMPVPTFLLTPLLHPRPGPETRYNRAHVKTRGVVEKLFGRLKMKFRAAFNTFQIKLSTVKAAIIAVAILHNMAVDDYLECNIMHFMLIINHKYYFFLDEDDIDNDEGEENYNDNLNENAVGNLFRQNYIRRHFT
ncbi:hypothetical protein NQ314_016539 [Rhamnusium bicolor]|uniref:THAP-type domain-containing protein n=1 Tax=Rhamnusium bicolor TaxID=1586634 RepID=A0AAV8WVD1_9CUCU|nr:hypothetical protein NQ314_016539 [Rhamnusium bicolor]